MHLSNSEFGEGNFLKLDAYETELAIPSSLYFVKASTCNCYEYKWKTHGAQTGDRGLGVISYYAMSLTVLDYRLYVCIRGTIISNIARRWMCVLPQYMPLPPQDWNGMALIENRNMCMLQHDYL